MTLYQMYLLNEAWSAEKVITIELDHKFTTIKGRDIFKSYLKDYIVTDIDDNYAYCRSGCGENKTITLYNLHLMNNQWHDNTEIILFTLFESLQYIVTGNDILNKRIPEFEVESFDGNYICVKNLN